MRKKNFLKKKKKINQKSILIKAKEKINKILLILIYNNNFSSFYIIYTHKFSIKNNICCSKGWQH